MKKDNWKVQDAILIHIALTVFFILSIFFLYGLGCGDLSHTNPIDPEFSGNGEVEEKVEDEIAEKEKVEDEIAEKEEVEEEIAEKEGITKEVKLTILHTNDLHSHLVGFGPEGEYTPGVTGDDKTLGGAARIATIMDRVREEVGEENVIALDAGDFTMGTIFEFLATTTGAELKVMDAIGIAATCPGNHEFDWGPKGTADIVKAGKKDTHIRILASNLVFSNEDEGDDELNALVEGGVVEKTAVIEMANGLKVGLFGLLGEDAVEVTPWISPVGISDLVTTAREMTDKLLEEGVDLVIALSHAGMAEGPASFEDEKIAKKGVEGLDVIVSGHTHAVMTEPEIYNDTVVVQAGCYGLYVGRLDLTVTDTGVIVDNYELIPVDDTVPGKPEITEMIEGFKSEIIDMGLSMDEVLAETAFDLPNTPLEETALGDLVADAIRSYANSVLPAGDPPVDIAIEANGVIRDPIQAGDTGIITVGDAFRVLPLGIGPDGVPGYPIVGFRITAEDLKHAAEIATLIPLLKGNDYFLQISGFRFEYDADADAFEQVAAIYLWDEQKNGYSGTPLDTSSDNKTLYRVAVNYYIAKMMSAVGDLLEPLTIIPKDQDGNPIDDFKPFILDRDSSETGIQEAKLWNSLFTFLPLFPDLDGDSIPDIPEMYSSPLGRMKPIE